MEAYYLTLATAEGNRVERFTDTDQLFDRVAEVAPLYEWNVSTSYLKAVAA